MTPEQAELLGKADESLAAAELLTREGFHGFAAARAYYAMFYVAEAALLSLGLAFSRHSAVHAAFGLHFAKPGLVSQSLHRDLIVAMEIRQGGDYGGPMDVTAEIAQAQIDKARAFVAGVAPLIGQAGVP